MCISVLFWLWQFSGPRQLNSQLHDQVVVGPALVEVLQAHHVVMLDPAWTPGGEQQHNVNSVVACASWRYAIHHQSADGGSDYCVCVCVSVWAVYLLVCICIVCIYMCAHVCLCVYVLYVCMYMCVCVCTCMCVCESMLDSIFVFTFSAQWSHSPDCCLPGISSSGISGRTGCPSSSHAP